MSSTRYWAWLSALTGLSTAAVRDLLSHFGGPMEIYFAQNGEYESVGRLTARERALLGDKSLREADRILSECERLGIRIMTLQDSDYPARLRQIYDAPAVLYLRGRLPYLDESPCIGVIGTRRCSVYGEKMALRIGYQLTKGGGIVISGLALGIDGAAAKGALMAGGRCVGVLGTAIDVDYPAANASLIRDVEAVGCVMSEYPPGCSYVNFPRRNRIISGLSCGVCVVEAPLKSGALITANDALEQGRDLFAVPGNADNPVCEGSNALLRDCARIVMSGADILEEYRGRYRVDPAAAKPVEMYTPAHSDAVSPKNAETRKTPGLPDMSHTDGIDKKDSIAYIDLEKRLQDCSEQQIALVDLLRGGELHADELIAKSGFSAAKTMAELTLLCIRGIVEAKPGKRYSIKE